MSSLKIAMIGQKGIPTVFGGIERHVEELSVRLVQRGHQVTVYTRKYYTPARRKNYRGVRLVSLPSLRTKHFDAITHTLLASWHALRHDFDIIHYHGVGPSLMSWLPRLFGSRAKVIATFHCIDRKHQKWGLIARVCLRLGEMAAVYFPHRTIGVSRSIRRYCRAVFHRQIDYIPNGVVIPAKPKGSRRLALAKFGLRSKEYILTVSRLIPHKGIHYLIEAWSKLNTSKKLVIVGDGFYTDQYVQRLKKLAAKNKRIIFTGWQRDPALSHLYQGAELFVLPSETEGLPFTLLEAASHGLPILASDIPENMEILHAQAQPVGFSFQTKNVADLRLKLATMLKRHGQLQTMRQHAQQMVTERYNWDMIVDQTIKLYRAARQPKIVATPLPRPRQVLVTEHS